MAQHDQNVANGSGSAVRGDVNDALAALFSLSSGATAPSVTVAYQWWVDTANGLLKQRNAANTGWIDHGDVTKELLRVDGDGSQLSGIVGLPVGVPFYWLGDTPPSWAYELDGSSLDTTTDAALFAIMGYTFGGSGASFNLPDLRGEFVRGWDNSRGVDSGRVFGSSQSANLADHKHQSMIQWSSSNANIIYYDDPDAGFGLGDATDTSLERYISGTSGGSPASAASYALTDIPYSGSLSGETRPRNVALLPCVKY